MEFSVSISFRRGVGKIAADTMVGGLQLLRAFREHQLGMRLERLLLI
jgi:hypothetical protein